jgi:ABC-type dipeptide/oligopeptide/nickel transport system permease subunit
MENVETLTEVNKDKPVEKGKSLWVHAWEQLRSDKYALVSMIIVCAYALTALFSFLGVFASNWDTQFTDSYLAPGAELLFGADLFGRSVMFKTIKGAEVAMTVGFIAALISMTIGVTLGAIAGFFGGKVDELIVWFYTTIASIPYIMLIIAISFISGKGLQSVCLALGLTSWVSLCRLIRGEVIRHKDREYVHAATSIGVGNFSRLFKHILPNVLHIVIINFSLQFQVAIKSEVILSYLGLGVQGTPSWGTMINDAKQELAQGVWWQLAAATLAMFLVVLALNTLGDALRDALDPKLKGKG